MKKKPKKKIINLPMKFNPGIERFEPELPTKDKKMKTPIQISWPWIIILILFFIIIQ
jgi:hypothetical protein